MQLWIDNRGSNSSVTVQAFRDTHVEFKDREFVAENSQKIVCLHSSEIDLVRIILRQPARLLRFHYDFENPPFYNESAQVCGIKPNTNPYKLEIPHEVEANFMLGGTVNKTADEKEQESEEYPYLVGLHWEANEQADVRLLPINALLFDLKLKQNNKLVNITGDSPILISPSLEDQSIVLNAPESWPKQRQFYLDYLTRISQREYLVRGRDIFGRFSEFSDPVGFDVELPAPPPPIKISAHFLDYLAYDRDTDSSTDQHLLDDDKQWLRNNEQSAIVVRWKWTSQLRNRAPEVDEFQVFLHYGWLNTYTGKLKDLYRQVIYLLLASI